MIRFNRSVFILLLLTLTAGPLHAVPDGTQGKLLYDKHCSICHSMSPPPKSAPPILGITMHYHQAFADRKDGVTHMVTFMKKPDAKQSKLEAAAVSRFGLMPAMTLSDKELEAVAGWLWESYDPNFKSPGNCAK